MEYRLPFARFAALCKELFNDKRLVALQQEPTTRVQPFQVALPANYRPEPEYDPTALTSDEMDRAIDLYEELVDLIEDAWDEEEGTDDNPDTDEKGPTERLRLSTSQSERKGAYRYKPRTSRR